MKKDEKIILAALGIGGLIALALLWPRPVEAKPTEPTPEIPVPPAQPEQCLW